MKNKPRLALLFLLLSAFIQSPTRAECVTVPLTCGSVRRGSLTSGDCSMSDGSLYDRYSFAQKSNTSIVVTMRPLSNNLPTAKLWISGPSTAPSPGAMISGSNEAVVEYRADGDLIVRPMAPNGLSSGDYLLQVDCYQSLPAPSECALQSLRCGQTLLWDLTRESCRFTNAQRAYVPVWVDIFPLVSFRALMTGVGFEPLVAVRDEDFNYLAVGSTAPIRTSEVSFRPQVDQDFFLIGTSETDGETGPFLLSLECPDYQCLRPILIQQPASVTVARGSTATLRAEAHANFDVTYEWWTAGFESVLAGTGQEWTTPPLSKSEAYYVVAKNACGESVSSVVDVEVVDVRRRPVRR